MELDLKQLFKPKKVLEFKTDQGVIKLHIQGVDSITGQYIEAIKARLYYTNEEQDKAAVEYFRRLISCSVKKIEGLTINKKDVVLQFKPGTEELTDESYDLLNRIFGVLKFDFAGEIVKFYNESQESYKDLIEFKEDSEEDTKKKE